MNKKGAEMDSLSKIRWDFFVKCWEYNIKIWKPTFLENKLRNPLLYQAFDRILIPYFGKLLGAYYSITRRGTGDQFKKAVYQLSLPMPNDRKNSGRKIKTKA
jgi:hypothetical protein